MRILGSFVFARGGRRRWRRLGGAARVVQVLVCAHVWSQGGFSEDRTWLAPSGLIVGSASDTLYVACERAGTVLTVNRETGKQETQIETAGPITGMGWASTLERLVLMIGRPTPAIQVHDPAANRMVNSWPARSGACAPVFDPNQSRLYVCNRFENSVSVYELASGEELACVPVLREPVGAALGQNGDRLFVTNLLPEEPANTGPVAAAVTVIDTAALGVERHIRLPDGSTGLRGVAVCPTGRWCAVVHSLARFRVATTQVEHGWMNTSALSLLDVDTRRLVATVLLDEPRQGAADPWDVAWTFDGKTLCIAHAGTHELSLIAMESLEQRLGEYRPAGLIGNWHVLEGIRQRIALSGRGPRRLAVSDKQLYVAEFFSDSISVIDLEKQQVADRLEFGPGSRVSLAAEGERWFHDATLARQNWQSCASCHPDGRADGLNWDLLNDGIGNPKNTKSLLLSPETPPVMSSGVRPDAEKAIYSGFRHILFRLPPGDAVEAIKRYLESLEATPSPLLENGRLSAAAERGRRLFEDPVVRCAQCHPAPLYTDLQSHAVGTGASSDEAGEAFDTPTLIECWRTAPYLHDGSARTVVEVLRDRNPGDRHGATSHLSPKEVGDLVAFVLSL